MLGVRVLFVFLFSFLFADATLRTDATAVFNYGLQQRLECGECHGVRYRVDAQDVLSVPVPAVTKAETGEGGKALYEDVRLVDCIEIVLGKEAVEGWACTRCGKAVAGVK